ncbi:MAG TPA: RtcB family protein [Thermoflexia bacterium]|jgi:tRNA-splicing ligase RtcB|nr:RtcB family protein [Thermoflexia bacterium]
MVAKGDFRRIERFIWELPKGTRPDMRVPARMFADPELLDAAFRDRTVEQLINTTTLPGIVKYALAMPDFHQGYGFPIGGVAAMRTDTGVISPGGVGYDINCGVRLLASHLEQEQVAPYLQDLTAALYRSCPSGVGGKGRVRVSERELDELVTKGARWALKRGLARAEDLAHTEEGGCMPGADPSQVSARAKQRGRPQVGSLGAGNHFLEIDVVEEIYDPDVADVFGLWEGQVVVQIHCGSRGYGHQICDDYVKRLQSAVQKYGIKLPDRELVCAPIDSPEGRAYYGAMACAVNYAFVNRQVLAMGVREAFEQVLAGKVKNFDLYQVYDVAHNIAKFEEHEVDGRRVRLCVHRKGATRAFGPGRPEVPEDYREVGQPVLVPGSMGTSSYVLVGTQRAMEISWGSTCHGAGRVMSRRQALKRIWGADLRRELEEQGIVIRAGSMKGLAEEAPAAYKDVSRVVEVVHGAGIARKVARLRPLAVIKG